MANVSANVHVLLFLLYFGQGLPYGFQVRLLPLLLRKENFSLSKVGLSRLLSLPWIFKFSVAPLIDNLWSLNSWIIWIMFGSIAMSSLCFISAFVGVSSTMILLFCVFWMNLTSALQDVAVDAFSISLLKPSELGIGSTVQVVGYKVGALFSGGLLAWLSIYCSWEWLFTLWGSFYIAILIFLLLNKNTESCTQHSKREEVTYRDCNKENIHDSDVSTNFKYGENSSMNQIQTSNDYTCKTTRLSVKHIVETIFKTSDFLWLVCCVLTYKLGEQGVVSMLPLYLIDQGIPQDQVGVIFGIFGQVFSITGSTLGGWMVGLHHGQRSWVIKVLLWMSFARLIPLASVWILSLTTLTKSSVIILECFIQLMGGVVTTATFTLMMLSSQSSSPGIRATHGAVLATAEVLGKLSMISLSGILVDNVGYQCFFGFCTVLALLVIPVLQPGLIFPRKKSL